MFQVSFLDIIRDIMGWMYTVYIMGQTVFVLPVVCEVTNPCQLLCVAVSAVETRLQHSAYW